MSICSISEKKSVSRLLYNWVCGVETKPKPKLTKLEKEVIKQKMKSIAEDPMSTRINTAAALIICTVCTFLLGFFG